MVGGNEKKEFYEDLLDIAGVYHISRRSPIGAKKCNFSP